MAKTTYTHTWRMTNEELQQATFRLEVFGDITKYDSFRSDEEPKHINYTGVKAWTMVAGGPEAEEIEADLNDLDCDEFHEYLILHFNNGEQATFRNSHVDLWIDKKSRAL